MTMFRLWTIQHEPERFMGYAMNDDDKIVYHTVMISREACLTDLMTKIRATFHNPDTKVTVFVDADKEPELMESIRKNYNQQMTGALPMSQRIYDLIFLMQLQSPDEIAKFGKWQRQDGTVAGLERLAKEIEDGKAKARRSDQRQRRSTRPKG